MKVGKLGRRSCSPDSACKQKGFLDLCAVGDWAQSLLKLCQLAGTIRGQGTQVSCAERERGLACGVLMSHCGKGRLPWSDMRPESRPSLCMPTLWCQHHRLGQTVTADLS